MFVISDMSQRMTPTMRKDMEDIYRMRFEGVSCTAFEARWKLIHIDELILDVENDSAPGVLMNRVTDHYWKKFAYDVNASFEMYGFVLWMTRKERVYAKDDVVRKRKFGDGAAKWAQVEIPFVVPFLSVVLETSMDEKFRETVVALDDYGRPRKDIYVSYSRRGGLRVKTQRFETECGSMLEDWRRYMSRVKLYDAVCQQNALVLPYLEHMPINEQTIMHEDARKMEDLLNPPAHLVPGDQPQPIQKVLVKVEKPPQSQVQSFIQVPSDRRLATVQPTGKLLFDIKDEHERWLGQLATTLQIPLRHVQTEEKKGLGSTSNEATVQDDMARAVRGAGERRNEIVDVLAEAFEKIYNVRPRDTHLPTASHMTPELLFQLHERGLMSNGTLKEEMGMVLGKTIDRFDGNGVWMSALKS